VNVLIIVRLEVEEDNFREVVGAAVNDMFTYGPPKKVHVVAPPSSDMVLDMLGVLHQSPLDAAPQQAPRKNNPTHYSSGK
jgi:hypothetical protein